MAKAQLPGKAPSEEQKNLTGKTQKPLEQGLQAETPSLQNAVNTRHQPTPSGIHMLQRTIGNRAVQSLVQKKQSGTNDSTVIQRHIGAAAEANGDLAIKMLGQSLGNMGQSISSVSMGQGLFSMAQAMGRAEPIPQPGESSDEGGEGHGYEFGDDMLESDSSLPNDIPQQSLY